MLSTINVSLRVSDVKHVDVEQADNLNYWKSSTKTILCFNVGWQGTISARARDIMGYPANVLSKGSYIFRKYQKSRCSPISTCTYHIGRHGRHTWRWSFNPFVVRPVDVNLFRLKTTRSWTCCFCFWFIIFIWQYWVPSHQHSRQGDIWGSFPLWRYSHVRYWMNRWIDALFSLQVFL